MKNKSRVRVLESVAPPGATIKYIDQVVRYAPADIEFSYFGWARALFGSYDVLHIHWPEFLIRSGRRPVRAIKRLLFRLLLLRLRVTSAAVVRTQHNLEPHEAGDDEERRLLEKLDLLTSTRVYLDAATRSAHGANVERFSENEKSTIIAHGDYREQLAGFARANAVSGRLLFFGRIEPYKSVPALMNAFERVASSGDELRIVGKAAASEGAAIENKAAAWSRTDAAVVLRLEHVSDAEMVTEMTAAEAVVLPYSEMHNSGVLLVALSLNTPVIVPASPTNENISREVGQGWVIQYEGPFNDETLKACINRVRETSRTAPNLSARDWPTVAARYAETFRDVVSRGVDIEKAGAVFVNAGGQRDNIGDSLLRRAYIDALRPLGSLHVYTGPDAEYTAGLGLQPQDQAYRSPKAWLLAAARGGLRHRAVLAINTGEVVGTAEEHRKGIWQPFLARAFKARGGRLIVAGVSIRPGTSPRQSSLRALARVADVLTWRDEATREIFGRGRVQPDWAYSLGANPEDWASLDNRDVLAVAMRGDRPVPHENWFRAVRGTAAATGSSIVVVVQVRRDAARAIELAERLGGSVQEWESGDDHAAQERKVRDVYARSKAVISDRIHALIVGYTEGAVPLGFSSGKVDKVVRSLAPATRAHRLVVPDRSASSESWVTAIGDRGALGDELTAARSIIDTVRKSLVK